VGVSPAIPFAAFSAKINDDEHQKKPRFHKKNTKIFEAIEYFNYKETLTNHNPDIGNLFGLFFLIVGQNTHKNSKGREYLS